MLRKATVTFRELASREIVVECEFDDADHPGLATAAINAAEEILGAGGGQVQGVFEVYDMEYGDVVVDGQPV